MSRYSLQLPLRILPSPLNQVRRSGENQRKKRSRQHDELSAGAIIMEGVIRGNDEQSSTSSAINLNLAFPIQGIVCNVMRRDKDCHEEGKSLDTGGSSASAADHNGCDDAEQEIVKELRRAVLHDLLVPLLRQKQQHQQQLDRQVERSTEREKNATVTKDYDAVVVPLLLRFRIVSDATKHTNSKAQAHKLIVQTLTKTVEAMDYAAAEISSVERFHVNLQVDIERCDIDDVGAVRIADWILEHTTTATQLTQPTPQVTTQLQSEGVGPSGPSSIVVPSRVRYTVTHLLLAGNSITTEGLSALLDSTFQRHDGDGDGEGVGNGNGDHHTTSDDHHNYHHNEPPPPDPPFFVSSLVHLGVTANPLGDSGVNCIIDRLLSTAASSSPSSSCPYLTTIHMTRVAWGEVAARGATSTTSSSSSLSGRRPSPPGPGALSYATARKLACVLTTPTPSSMVSDHDAPLLSSARPPQPPSTTQQSNNPMLPSLTKVYFKQNEIKEEETEEEEEDGDGKVSRTDCGTEQKEGAMKKGQQMIIQWPSYVVT